MSHPLDTSPASKAKTIAMRFEEQVAANRHRLAVRADRTLSYETLNQEANRIARVVLTAIPEADTVGVLTGHRTSVIAAMLGVLKAGKVFVPLDPRQPPARLLRILDDCRARVLVTDGESLEAAYGLLRPGMQRINVDAIDASVDTHNLDLAGNSEALACLMYTSGSTGVPKGVMQTHRSLVCRMSALTALLQIDRNDRVALLASCSVAQGVSTTLQALFTGASLHPFDLKERGIGDLAAWLVEERITVLVCSPSTFRHFARTLSTRADFPDMRVIRLGSEQMLPRDFDLYRQHFTPRCVVVASLASTESGQVAAYVMNHDSDIADVVPAGYPVDGTTVHILDDTDSVCPVGETGEIVVQSNFLFSGYWDDPARTAAAFVSVTGAAGKFYRTGDLGRLRSDGSLQYVGRKNLQVKIRGYRVELEEIERALWAHPSVVEAAVIVESNQSGDQKVVAHVVPANDRGLGADDLRAHLRNTLPEQMVPSAFRFLSALPKTASGKICRATLSARLDAPCHIPAPHRAPADGVEVCLLRIWEELLEQSPISVTANFFELGGHSLLTARLSTSIERTFGAKLPLSAFVDAATVEQQARLIRDHRKNGPWPSLVPIRAIGTKPPLFCLHLREGDVLSYRDLARYLPSDQPLYGLQSRGLDGMRPMNTRIEEMARDYVAEIRTAFPRGPYAICGWSFGGVVAFEVARQLEQEGQVVPLLALFDSVLPKAARRSGTLLRREVMRTPAHLKALLDGRKRVAYARKKLNTARRLLEFPFWRMIVRWHRRGGWLPRALRNVYQANRVAGREYVPRPYGGRITLFKVMRVGADDPCQGWHALAAGGLETHEVPGTHLNMVFEPHARTLAGILSRTLDKAWDSVKS